MTRIARMAAMVAAAALTGAALATPAFAHGAPTQPISRTAACAGGGSDTGASACKAAVKANGQAFGAFDNLRVPNVNGADRSRIPDGKLCSGGLAAYKGLDLPRTDWPSTTLTAGGTYNVTYKATIPHDGGFRVYLTKQGYDPAKTLAWDDLSSSPILTVKNAKLSGGAYHMSGKLPADRSGRHILYIVWQTTSTPDTYYSCSDLVIKPAEVAKAAPPSPARTTPAARKPAATRSPAAVAPATSSSAPPAAVRAAVAPALSPVSDQTNWKADLGREIVAGALLVIVAVVAGMALMRIRRRREPRG